MPSMGLCDGWMGGWISGWLDECINDGGWMGRWVEVMDKWVRG